MQNKIAGSKHENLSLVLSRQSNVLVIVIEKKPRKARKKYEKLASGQVNICIPAICPPSKTVSR
jgi:uncharacterized protein YceH (UPF0502 family)